MDIYQRFVFLREKAGFKKQKDYANFLGIAPASVNAIEVGSREPSKNVLEQLFYKQNVNIIWLLTGEGEPFVKEATEPEKPAILQEIENTAVEATAPKFAEHENRFTEIEKKQQSLENEIRELYDLYYNTPEENKPRKVIRRGMSSKGIITEKYGILYPDGTFIEDPNPDTVSEPAPSYTADYEEPAEPAETEELPLAVNLAAGVPVEACDINETYPVPKKLIPNAGKKYCVAKINGTSMTEAGIPDGSYVLLEYTDQPVNGKNMVVKYGSNTTLKLLHQTEQGSWELLYCDGSGAKIELKNGDWEVKGKFITVLPKKRQ